MGQGQSIDKYRSDGTHVLSIPVGFDITAFTVDGDDNLYVGRADESAVGVYKGTFQGGSYVFDRFDKGPELCLPAALAVRDSQNVYVADTDRSGCDSSAVRVYNHEGGYITDVANNIRGVTSVSVDYHDSLFIAQHYQYPENQILKAVPVEGGGFDISRFDSGLELCGPRAVAWDTLGNVYVFDLGDSDYSSCSSSNVEKFGADGKYLEPVSGVSFTEQLRIQGNPLAVEPYSGDVFFPMMSGGVGKDRIMLAEPYGPPPAPTCNDVPPCNNSWSWDKCRDPDGNEYMQVQAADLGPVRYRCRGVGPTNSCHWKYDDKDSGLSCGELFSCQCPPK